MSCLVMNWWMDNAIQWMNRHLVAMGKHTTLSTGSIMIYPSLKQVEPVPGGTSTKFYTGRLQPKVQPLTLLCTILTEREPRFSYL